MVRSALLVLCVGLAGCYSKATAHDGHFTFAYTSGVDVDNFVKPIAVGATLEVVAFANGTNDALEIVSVRSSKPGVLAIAETNGAHVRLLGKAPGVVDVEITAKDAAGKTLVDRMFFHVGTPTSHRVQHACTDAREAIYVRGEPVDLLHSLAVADGRAAIGVDYVPLRFEPADVLTLQEQPQGFDMYRFRASRAAQVSIRSNVDDSAIAARIVEPREIDDVMLHHAERMLEGDSMYVVAEVGLGTTPVCTQSARTQARSLTPEICSVSASLEDDPDADSNHEQLARVTALKYGECRFELSFPELGAGGIVRSGSMLIGRTEFPGERSTSRELTSLARTLVSTVLALDLSKVAVACAALLLLLARRRRKS